MLFSTSSFFLKELYPSNNKTIDSILLFQFSLLKFFQSIMMLIIQFLNAILIIISKFPIKIRCCNGCRYLNSACSYIKLILFQCIYNFSSNTFSMKFRKTQTHRSMLSVSLPQKLEIEPVPTIFPSNSKTYICA